MGTIKATIKHIYINGQSVQSGYFSPRSKPIFRSESARYVLFIQMSREMWDFDAEGAGEIMFNKVVSGFLPDLFKRWLKINAKHVVTIILFTRMQYDEEYLTNRPSDTTGDSHAQEQDVPYRDYYRVVVSDMASIDWINILYQLKKEFRTFLREVSTMQNPMKKSYYGEDSKLHDPVAHSIVAGRPSPASQGNILEAINLAAAQFAKDYIDRDLVRTGISVIVVTPGTGVFEVDYNMLKLTTDTLIGSGIGIDLVCLSPMPLHSVPLFKYRAPRSVSDLRAEETRKRNAANELDREDEKTPRQHQPNFGTVSRIESVQSMHSLAQESVSYPIDTSEEWRFAMPYWVDVSFWSGTSEEILELTKPRKADKIVKKARKKGRIFSLRCRLYEMQMMGAVGNELGSISIPYLQEDPMFPHHLRQIQEPNSEQRHDKDFLPKAPAAAMGSYSSRGDKDLNDDQLDEKRTAHKAWMEMYDDNIHMSLEEPQLNTEPQQAQLRRQSGFLLGGSPDLHRGSYLSTSLRSTGSSLGRSARLPIDANVHQLSRERSRDMVAHSPKNRASPLVERASPGVPRADVLKRQSAMPHNSKEIGRLGMHRRNASGDSQDYKGSIQITPKQSPAPSRRSSPPRRAGAPTTTAISTPLPAPKMTSTPTPKSETTSRPNWFLRSISFAGKAAPAKPTLGDATIDISQGKVKPAMLTVEHNQKGLIAERLASTRLNSSEKPSQPIAIKPTSRAGPVTAESLTSDRASRSIETVKGVNAGTPSVPSNSGSVIKDPGSTFLLAGARGAGEHLGSKPDLSSSGGAKEVPRTLSPTSAIAPWAVLVNPCNPKKNLINTKNQYRRWHHVFPRTMRTGTVKWRSLCSPAAVPLTHEWFPSAQQVATEYNESPYKISPNEDDDMLEVPQSRESLIKELIGFRLSHGFQITVGSAVAEFSGRQEKTLASILAPDYMSADGDTIFMSVGNSIHQLVCVAGGEVDVRRYNRKPTTALETSAGIDRPFPYRPYIRTAFEDTYEMREVVLQPPRREYNWNIIDSFLAGYEDEFSEVLRFWRARFILIPVDIPSIHKRGLHMLPEDSAEEVRLEGIQKLTQLWQKHRFITPEERSYHHTASMRQKDANPLAIEYRTGDASAVIAAGLDHAIFNDADSVFQTSIFSDSEKYHSSNIDLKRLAEDLQSEKGIQMLDRRWHLKLHYNCFTGFDLTSWLQANFRDVETREEAVHLGNELLNKGLFVHVQRRHPFRDGNFFFAIAEQYRAPRTDSRTGWFGMRRPDRSVPSTPLTEGPRTTPTSSRSSKQRPDTADSSSTSSTGTQDADTSAAHESHQKRKVVLSRAMRYDVDPRRRSYRPEIISLHYDRLHSPDNCYHIRIEWMNVTAKLIEDAIVTWATSVEKYGLKLVEVPIAEVASITEHHPFRSPYAVTLALQPPKPQQESGRDSAILPPQYSKTDKFAYHKALLRKLDFVLDTEAASAFPVDVDVSYSWGRPDFKFTQFIHRSGTLLAQITDEGNFLLLANRLVHNRAKDHNRLKPVDPYEHKKVTTDGSQSGWLPSTPAERTNAHRSPFASPLARPVQDSSLLHTALSAHDRLTPAPAPAPASASTPLNSTTATVTPEQVKDAVEAFCTNADLLSAFYKVAFRQAPSPSPRLLPVLDDKIPALGLPPAISVREASPANTGWSLSSHTVERGERGLARGISEMHIGASSGIAGRRQGSEGSMSTLGKRGSIFDINPEHLPRRQDSHGSTGE